MKRYAPLLCAAVVFVSASAARAQDAGYPTEPVSAAQNTSYDAPAHIALVEGAASLERDGRTDTAPSSMPLLAGDRVRTQVGRVEVLFVDGSTLHLDHHTTLDFQSDEVVRLLSGRVRLNIPGPSRDVEYRVDAPGAWVQIDYPGEYRIALLSDDEVELAVLRGTAELVNEDGRRPLRAGERAFARAGAAPSLAYVFNSASWDAFDRWSEGRRDERLGLSTQYLPDEVRPYASTFDRYGSWRHEPTYGYVWYPTVDVGWRPYYRGRWTTLRPYGWTWIGLDPWAWPTHHYGRWGFSAGVWFWIPGRHWGPAWVSWAYAPGYVSWCPLGWNNRPVIGFVNINIYRGYRGRYYDPWHAWTIVPRRHFGRSYVNAHFIHGSRIEGRVRSAFVVRDRAPAITGYAVPRAAAPIRTAGRRVGTAVPRGTAPSPTELRRGDSSGVRSEVPFRSQRPGVRSTGPGFPAASRAPRAPSSVTTPSRRPAAAVPERGAASSGAVRVAPRRNGTPYDPGPSRRVVPRDRVPGGNIDAGSRRAAPARSPSPSYGEPAARPRVPYSPDRDGSVGPRSRPMPRSGDNPVYAPRQQPSYERPAYRSPARGGEGDRGRPSAPSAMPDRPRAVPRGGDAPSYGRPAPSPRPERSAPPPNYGPRPSPRQERAAPPPRQADPGDRPGGGGGGRAVRRPRGQ